MVNPSSSHNNTLPMLNASLQAKSCTAQGRSMPGWQTKSSL